MSAVVSNIVSFDRGAMLRAALAYASMGWHVLPCWGTVHTDDGKPGRCGCGHADCPSPGKHPHGILARTGQMAATPDPDTIRRWFASGHELNIGIQLSQSRLAAIDVDPRNGGALSLENLEAKYGPLSSGVEQISGGGGQHFVYSNPHGVHGLPGKLGPGLDVKANGYIIVWPSRHWTGGLYEWEASSDPTEGCVPSPLPDWMRDLAGGRHQDAPEWRGSRYVTEEQIEDLRSALACLPADDYHQWINFGQALKAAGGAGFELWDSWSQTSGKYHGPVMGPKWRSFRPGAYQIESIFHAAMQAGWTNPATKTVQSDVPLITPDSPPEVELPPSYQYSESVDVAPVFDQPIPGVLGQFEEWAFRSSLSATPSRHSARMAALGFGSIVLARKYKTQRDNYSSLLFLQIDESGGGKEDLKTAIDKAMRSTGLHASRCGGSWYTSEIGVISALHEKPAHITIVDEFGLKIANSRKNGHATSASALSAVMEVSTKCHSSISSTAAGTRGLNKAEAARMQMTVVNPGLSVVAMSTRSSMIEALTAEDITSGFLNRWIIMVNPTQPATPDYSRFFAAQPDTPLPAAVIQWVDEYCCLPAGATPECADPSSSVEATVIPFTARAQALVIQYLNDIERMKATVFIGAPEMTKRMNEAAMRLSLIVALSDRQNAIDTAHFAWARNFVTSHQIAAFRALASQLAGTEFGKLRNSILDFIRTRNAGHAVSRRDLGQSCRAWKEAQKYMRDSAIAVLIEDGMITRNETKTTAGRTVITYSALTDEVAAELSG